MPICGELLSWLRLFWFRLVGLETQRQGSRQGGFAITASMLLIGAVMIVSAAIIPLASYISNTSTDNRSSASSEQCAWCAGNDQCYQSTGHAPESGGPVAVCGGLSCCTGYVPAGSGGSGGSEQPAPQSCASGWSCNGKCADGNTVKLFKNTWCDGKAQWLWEAAGNNSGCGGSPSTPKSEGCGSTAGGSQSTPDTTLGQGCSTRGTACPAGTICCGGCIDGCRPATQGCNAWIDQECTVAGCGGEGTAPAPGESCCPGLTKCANGRCAKSCPLDQNPVCGGIREGSDCQNGGKWVCESEDPGGSGHCEGGSWSVGTGGAGGATEPKQQCSTPLGTLSDGESRQAQQCGTNDCPSNQKAKYVCQDGVAAKSCVASQECGAEACEYNSLGQCNASKDKRCSCSGGTCYWRADTTCSTCSTPVGTLNHGESRQAQQCGTDGCPSTQRAEYGCDGGAATKSCVSVGCVSPEECARHNLFSPYEAGAGKCANILPTFIDGCYECQINQGDQCQLDRCTCPDGGTVGNQEECGGQSESELPENEFGDIAGDPTQVEDTSQCKDDQKGTCPDGQECVWMAPYGIGNFYQCLDEAEVNLIEPDAPQNAAPDTVEQEELGETSQRSSDQTEDLPSDEKSCGFTCTLRELLQPVVSTIVQNREELAQKAIDTYYTNQVTCGTIRFQDDCEKVLGCTLDTTGVGYVCRPDPSYAQINTEQQCPTANFLINGHSMPITAKVGFAGYGEDGFCYQCVDSSSGPRYVVADNYQCRKMNQPRVEADFPQSPCYSFSAENCRQDTTCTIIEGQCKPVSDLVNAEQPLEVRLETENIDVPLYTKTMNYAFNILPDHIYENLTKIQLIEYIPGHWYAGACGINGGSNVALTSACHCADTGLSSDVHARISCDVTLEDGVDPALLHTTVHEINHLNYDRTYIESPYCEDPSGTCAVSEALHVASALGPNPLEFDSRDKLANDDEYLQSIYASDEDPAYEVLNELLTWYVLSPDKLQAEFPDVYEVARTLYQGAEYERFVDENGIQMIRRKTL